MKKNSKIDVQALLNRVGSRLRLLRVDHEFTLRDLEKAIGIDRSRLSKIERGDTKSFAVAELAALLNFYNGKLPNGKQPYTSDEIILSDDFRVRNK